MSVVILLAGRCWTSVNAIELMDHMSCDGALNGPTYIARDHLGIPPDESVLYNQLNVRQVKETLWSTNHAPATVISMNDRCCLTND